MPNVISPPIGLDVNNGNDSSRTVAQVSGPYLRILQQVGPLEDGMAGWGHPNTSFAPLGYPRCRKNGGHIPFRYVRDRVSTTLKYATCLTASGFPGLLAPVRSRIFASISPESSVRESVSVRRAPRYPSPGAKYV